MLTPDAKWLGSWEGRYALDNGVWGIHAHNERQRKRIAEGKPHKPFRIWEGAPFEALLKKYGAGADWAVLPDIVAGGAASLALSLSWRGKVLADCPLALLPVQDGMKPCDIAPHLGPQVAIFVGGSTDWKEASMRQWCELGRRCGVIVHVGRVNTVRRILMCARERAHSFDGTSGSRYAKTIAKIDAASRQRPLLGAL